MLGFMVHPDLLRKAVEVVVAADAVSVTLVVTDTFFLVGDRVWHSSTCVGLLQITGLVMLSCTVIAIGCFAAGIVGWIASHRWT